MKKRESYPIFCCFCEEKRPRRKTGDEESQKTSNESIHKSREHRIDTNSNFSSNIPNEKKSVNSILSIPKSNNNNMINYQNKDNTLKGTQSKAYTNYSYINNPKKNKINFDQKSNITYNTMNENIKKLIDKNKLSKQEINSSLKKRNNSITLQKLSFDMDGLQKQKMNPHLSNNAQNNNNINVNDNTEQNYLLNNYKINDNTPNNYKINKDINEKKVKNNNNFTLKYGGFKGMSQRNIFKNTGVFEYEEDISNEQFIKQNKSNLNKSIVSNIINHSIYDQIPKEEEIKNINDSKSLLNNTNNKNSDKIQNIKYVLNNDNRIDYSKNEINTVLIPKYADDQIIQNNLTNMHENEKRTNNQNEQSKINDNTDNFIYSINEPQIDTNNFNNLLTNPINYINIENQNVDKEENEENGNITKREESKINILNDINNDETLNNDLNVDNAKDYMYSKTVRIKNNNNNYFFNYNNDISNNEEGINNNSQDIQLNYLTEFYSTLPQENKSVIMNEQKDNENNMDKKTKKSIKKSKEEKDKNEENENENENDELEDEVGSMDEFHNANDNRSILSSYIFTSVHLTESKSLAQSIYTKSEYQDGASNFGDLSSNRGGIIPPRLNSREFEFKFDKGMNFIPVIKENNKNYYNNPNANNFLNMQITNSIKKMKEKISGKEALIKKNSDNIDNMKKKIKNIDDANKQYERWIEKVEEENERLSHLLNFLMINN